MLLAPITCAESKPRLLWIAVKLFDKSVDKATWVETANHLAETFQVCFLTGWRDSPARLCIAGRPVRYFQQFGGGGLRKITRRLLMKRSVRMEIARLRPQVVVLNCLDDVSVLDEVVRNCKGCGCIPIFDVRTLPTTDSSSPAFHRFERTLAFAAMHFAGVTYITEEMKEYCSRRFHLPDHRSAIWSSGVNSDLFNMAPMMPEEEPFRLIYHGGIISVSRGLDRLIQAISLLGDLDVRLTLVSSLREPEAVVWIQRLNLKDRVALVDSIPYGDVPGIIQKHHAGVLPLPSCDVWNTSSPIKLYEYMSCGRPVIVTDIPAHRNVLDGMPFAFFAHDASPKALAEAIRCAYAARGSFVDLGGLARRQVLKMHTWKHQAELLGQFITKLME